MTFETSNASMVSGLVDYMSTLVSGDRTIPADHGRSDKPPPLPPKVHRVASADPPAKPVCTSDLVSSTAFIFSHDRHGQWFKKTDSDDSSNAGPIVFGTVTI